MSRRVCEGQCFGSGSGVEVLPGSGSAFGMRIRVSDPDA
jgi:hypothetical protein